MDLTTNENAILTLPQETLNTIGRGSDISMAFTVYRETTLFPVSEEPETTHNITSAGSTTPFIGSYVVSAIVDGIEDGVTLNAPVQFSLRLFNVSLAKFNDSNINTSCVFWDYNGAGEFELLLHFSLPPPPPPPPPFATPFL